MATKVFISWSGDLSEKLGEVLRKWLPGVLQYVKPYFTPEDVEKGTKWDSEITRELEESNIGLICLTRDNIDRAWILFEAGALSKSFEKSRVCTILFNLDTTDLKGPLTSFQHTRFNREDIKRLVETINNAAGDDKLQSQVLENVFDMWWPNLEEQVSEILTSHQVDDPKARRPERDILEEVLELSRMSARRSGHRFSEEAVEILVQGLEEFFGVLMREDPNRAYALLRRLNRPLQHLCKVLHLPSAAKNFRLILEQTSPRFQQNLLKGKVEEESEEADPQSEPAF